VPVRIHCTIHGTRATVVCARTPRDEIALMGRVLEANAPRPAVAGRQKPYILLFRHRNVGSPKRRKMPFEASPKG